jgi:hypothetical protein
VSTNHDENWQQTRLVNFKSKAMKKFFVTVMVTVSVCSHVALAANNHSYLSPVTQEVYQKRTVHDPAPVTNKGDKVSCCVQAAFFKAFAGASLLKWEHVKSSDLCQAYFTYNSERYNAFFDDNGKLVATCRFISESNLPLLIRQSISHKYASYQLQQVIELTHNEETTYLLTFENEQKKLETQAYMNGSIYTLKKQKKNFVAKL